MTSLVMCAFLTAFFSLCLYSGANGQTPQEQPPIRTYLAFHYGPLTALGIGKAKQRMTREILSCWSITLRAYYPPTYDTSREVPPFSYFMMNLGYSKQKCLSAMRSTGICRFGIGYTITPGLLVQMPHADFLSPVLFAAVFIAVNWSIGHASIMSVEVPFYGLVAPLLPHFWEPLILRVGAASISIPNVLPIYLRLYLPYEKREKSPHTLTQPEITPTQ